MATKLLHTYNPMPYSFVRGEGVWLYDAAGKRYLDALSGIAVTGLGHTHPKVTQAIVEQANRIIHASNVVNIPQQEELAELLAQHAGFDAKVFFGNSGAEAVEAAVKLARLYGHSRNIAKPKIAVATGAFHGRTMAALSASANKKVQAGFEPLVFGFVRVEYNDTSALEAALNADPDICAVLLEPIQGESGVNLPDDNYLGAVRKLCTKHKALFIVDEIQAGMARTGKLWCYQHASVVPDAFTLAKGLANGMPIGALVVSEPFASLFTVGSHGSTFGGNPLSCSAGIATLNTIIQERLWENAALMGSKLLQGLEDKLTHPAIVAIRGRGLMIGIALDKPCREVLKPLFAKGLICNVANNTVIRLLPPLILTEEHVTMIIDIMSQVVLEFLNE